MKFFYFLVILFLFYSCSFDNKSGIWISENQNLKKKKNFPELETLISSKASFGEIIKLKKNYALQSNIKAFIKKFKVPSEIKLYIDVDPINFL